MLARDLLADLSGRYPGLRLPTVLLLDGALSTEHCRALRRRIDEGAPAIAPISTGRGFELRPELRNNERVIFDDPALGRALFQVLEGEVPSRLRLRDEGREVSACGLNERFRGYRYSPGQRFGPHYDGAYARSAEERSELTVLFYLNDGFVGGATRFLDLQLEVQPKEGQALIFTHAVLHEGAMVEQGTKYVLRSDVMYRRT